jgi:hypothetical protein
MSVNMQLASFLDRAAFAIGPHHRSNIFFDVA